MDIMQLLFRIIHFHFSVEILYLREMQKQHLNELVTISCDDQCFKRDNERMDEKSSECDVTVKVTFSSVDH